MEFKDKLKKLRSESGATQRQLADKLGIKLPTLASYEEGRAYPKPEVMKKIVDLFAISNVDESLYEFLFQNEIA